MVTLGPSGIIVESRWVYEGPFSKQLIFPIDSNRFIKRSGHFGGSSGSLWDHFWHMRVTLRHFGATSGSLWDRVWA